MAFYNRYRRLRKSVERFIDSVAIEPSQRRMRSSKELSSRADAGTSTEVAPHYDGSCCSAVLQDVTLLCHSHFTT